MADELKTPVTEETPAEAVAEETPAAAVEETPVEAAAEETAAISLRKMLLLIVLPPFPYFCA